MLQVNSLQKSYHKQKILNDVNLIVKPGEVVGLVGENGAGKSTLLEILATVQPQSNGSIILEDKSYSKDIKNIRKIIGYVPQEISLWEEFTVAENFMFFEKLSWKRRSLEECKQLCLDMQLNKWDEPVDSLSGGMKRKLNLAISLIHDPILILLDEPTVGIDMKSKEEIGNYLVNLAKNEGKMIIYTSHDMSEITSFCDRIYCLGKDPFYADLLKSRGIAVEELV
ncbi:ABC transporter ATP-binding protein [Psychrobacillus psychrodurans]|uniref:ABC transporter ATP-binding protein n=1 Tax=Psychrobacillus psychrodurans TaxID=126157 RepID=UPI0008DF522E|nr:ABC transporter ATP-binding protein [Psychrobacillus psychrodurans]SFM28646.1 ABC-2 type transport system ATP-binding protein [Psychrobacillus psychrodurans]